MVEILHKQVRFKWFGTIWQFAVVLTLYQVHILQGSARQRSANHRLAEADSGRDGATGAVPQHGLATEPARGASGVSKNNRILLLLIIINVGFRGVGEHRRGGQLAAAIVAHPVEAAHECGRPSGGPRAGRHGGRALAGHHQRLRCLVCCPCPRCFFFFFFWDERQSSEVARKGSFVSYEHQLYIQTPFLHYLLFATTCCTGTGIQIMSTVILFNCRILCLSWSACINFFKRSWWCLSFFPLGKFCVCVVELVLRWNGFQFHVYYVLLSILSILCRVVVM